MNDLILCSKYRLTLLLVLFLSVQSDAQDVTDWTHFVRIAGHPLHAGLVDSIVAGSAASGVYGIEVDNDIPGRYDSFQYPAEKLEAIRLVSKKAHEAGNRTFVYIAGLECITAEADKNTHTFYKDHPDWVQRDLNGRPAVFGDNDAFWIQEGDEDVWITPYAADWREIYMHRVREIAATGVDGIYVDIPYWMTHFDGWWDSWASFDDYTLDTFQKASGLNAKRDFKLGDRTDPGFRRWIDFRIKAITGFMEEIDHNIKIINPDCKTIAEIYPGLGEDAVRVGADVYQLYEVVDAICHEYSEGAYMAADREPSDWFKYMAGMYSFRAFAGSRPTWMLSYSWDGGEAVEPSEAMELLFLSQIMAGANVWDARGHVMSGSNDLATRKKVFEWIKRWESVFYSRRETMTPVGLYFSPKTRDYFTDDYLPAYMGTLQLLLQSHLEFQIVTPRTLADFKGPVLILSEVRCLSEEEAAAFTLLNRSGTSLLLSGPAGEYDLTGKKRKTDLLKSLPEFADKEEKIKNIILSSDPGAAYQTVLEQSNDPVAGRDSLQTAALGKARREFVRILSGLSGFHPKVYVEASPFICSQTASVNGRVMVFLANFKGIRGGERLKPLPEKDLLINVTTNTAENVYFLPYLGEKIKLRAGYDGRISTVTIPELKQGGVVIFGDDG